MWKLVSDSAIYDNGGFPIGAVICRKETIEEIGAEKLWYENRGYPCHVEQERQTASNQSHLPVMD